MIPRIRYTLLTATDDGRNRWLVTVLGLDGSPVRRPPVFLRVATDGTQWLLDDGQTAKGGQLSCWAAGVAHANCYQIDDGTQIVVWCIPSGMDLEAAICQFAGVIPWMAAGVAGKPMPTPTATPATLVTVTSDPASPAPTPPERTSKPASRCNRFILPGKVRQRQRQRKRRRGMEAKDVPGTKINTRRVQTMVPPEVYQRLEDEAKRAKMSFSALIRRILVSHLETRHVAR